MEIEKYKVHVNGTEFLINVEKTYDDTTKVPLIPKQSDQDIWNYEKKLANLKGMR